jgi:TadE-like protein
MRHRYRPMRDRFRRAGSGGQALVEFALVFPLFAMLLFGVIVWGLDVFYQQQLTNATREAARYASIHSATAQCPTVSTLDPVPITPTSYYRCDPPTSWPRMTAAARDAAWGLNTAAINVAACWSGWVSQQPSPGSGPLAGTYDAPPPGPYAIGGSSTTFNTTWAPCSIGGVQDPEANSSQIACAPNLTTVDTASDQSDRAGMTVANTVTVYACFQWSPPMAGFLLIPSTVTQVAVITESIERQQ